MLSSRYHCVRPPNEEERARLENLIREDYERCHPGDTLENLRRRATFLREDQGLYREWLALAAARAGTAAQRKAAA